MEWFLALDEATVVKVQSQFVPEVSDGSIRVLLEVKHSLSVADFLYPRGVSVPLDPQPENTVELLPVVTILGVQGVKVIVIACSGDQLLESLGSIFSNGELLDVAN